jgi:4-alpha-glucanotransferase
MALKDYHGGKSWLEWEDTYRFLDAKTRKHITEELKDNIGYYQFIQFVFFKQWYALKAYANKKGISVIGDIPIFVSPDSADVWANKSLFKLDSKGFPTSVAGVPPDYFSATGQLWGNPLYNWAEHKKTGYEWWIARISSQLKLVDYLRIDHFRGFEAYWSIPNGEETAINGKWMKGPGASLFHAIEKALGKGLPIFAEDLGVITPQVEKLRDTFHFPGMKVLQFAFDDTAESAFLPYLYNENCICYTGTHDNDTTVGWYQAASEASRDKVRRYMNCDGGSIHWDFIRTALGSTARYAIFPLQDLFGYGSDCRMNTPGVAAGNWSWRYQADKLTPELADALKKICEVYGRDHARMEAANE